MNCLNNKHWDILTIGALAGITGVIVKDLLELVALFFIPSFKTCPRLAAGIIFSPEIVMESVLPIVGLEIDVAVSIVVGLLVAVVLCSAGWKHLLAKGIIVGLLAWAIIDITLSKLLSQVPPPDSFGQTQISLLIHIIYGITVVGVAWRLRKFNLPK